MYGIVNQAIKGLVVESFGQENWDKIKEKSGVTEVSFLNNEAYPDKVTYDLAIAAADVLELPLSEVLNAFGEYWVLKTGKEKYGDLMASGGSNLKDFLINLPNFHSRVMLMYPNITPPSFKVEEVKDQSLHLHYISHRPGLKDFVVGLIQGLGKMYDTPVKSELLQSRDAGADREVFLIEW